MRKAKITHGAVTINGVAIRETPGASGGYPCVGNTRIAIRGIVLVHRERGSVEGTVEALPWLTTAEVKTALDYYPTYPARVDEDVEHNAHAWQEITSRSWSTEAQGS